MKPKPTSKPRAPAHLRPATRRWYLDVVRDYELEAHHLRLLQLAGEAWDRCTEARQQITADGITFKDDRGNIRAHPAIAIERDSRIGFARLLRELDLDTEPPPAPNAARPPALRSNRRAAYAPVAA